jgi:hypothetical protein
LNSLELRQVLRFSNPFALRHFAIPPLRDRKSDVLPLADRAGDARHAWQQVKSCQDLADSWRAPSTPKT